MTGKKSETTPVNDSREVCRGNRITSDDQLVFLMSCIRHAVNGKVDFQLVADECSIVSKGAAAKRYERLCKAHGVSGVISPGPRDNNAKPASRTKPSKAKGPSKKRKLESADSTEDERFDEPSSEPDSLLSSSPLVAKAGGIKTDPGTFTPLNGFKASGAGTDIY